MARGGLKEGPTWWRGARGIEGRPDVWSGLPVHWGTWGLLPCGGGDGLGFRSGLVFCGELGNDAELLHHAQSVPVDVAFRQLAVQEASDGHAGDGERLSGGGNPVEIPFVGTVTRPTGHDGIAFGNEVLDGQAHVGESGAVEGCSLPFTLRAVPKIGRRRVMMSVVGGKELVCHGQTALVPKFFKQTTDDSFVLF